jgi:hypothetical protein
MGTFSELSGKDGASLSKAKCDRTTVFGDSTLPMTFHFVRQPRTPGEVMTEDSERDD